MPPTAMAVDEVEQGVPLGKEHGLSIEEGGEGGEILDHRKKGVGRIAGFTRFGRAWKESTDSFVEFQETGEEPA